MNDLIEYLTLRIDELEEESNKHMPSPYTACIDSKVLAYREILDFINKKKENHEK